MSFHTSPKQHLPSSSRFSQVSAATREKAAANGNALPDGSFPIADKADLKRAIQAFGRAKDRDKVKKHIKKRARALDAENLLPDSWKTPHETSLAEKLTQYNAAAAQERRCTLPKLELIYQRGWDKYESTTRALARVNSFLAALSSDEIPTKDADLLPRSHPLAR